MPFSPTFHKISINPFSKRPIAFQHRKEHYAWQYCPDITEKQVCEIIFVQEGTLVAVNPEGEKVYPPGTVHTLLMNRNFREYCKDPVYREAMLRFFVYTPYEVMSPEEVAVWQPQPYEAILPDYVEDPIACERMGTLLKNAARVYKKKGSAWILQMYAILAELLAILTEHAVLQARQLITRPENRRSSATDRACAYIREHLAEKCSVQELAKAIGSSYDYLSRVFRRDMNMTVVEYWNRSRVHRVEQLITSEGMPLSQAGIEVGIPEVKYLSRLFHRYTGMTVRDFRHIYQDRTGSIPPCE